MNTPPIEESTTPPTASLLFTGEVQWSFAMRPNNGFLMGSMIDGLVESCGYDWNGRVLTKRYGGACQCQGCQSETSLVTIKIHHDERFTVSAVVPYADYESHPRIECETELKNVWQAVLGDLLKTGVGFDDDVYTKADAMETK